MALADRPDSDVDRALHAFGAGTLHYRSFTPAYPAPAVAPARDAAGAEPPPVATPAQDGGRQSRLQVPPMPDGPRHPSPAPPDATGPAAFPDLAAPKLTSGIAVARPLPAPLRLPAMPAAPELTALQRTTLETAFVLELAAPRQPTSAVPPAPWRPAATVLTAAGPPLAALFRTLGQPPRATAPDPDWPDA